MSPYKQITLPVLPAQIRARLGEGHSRILPGSGSHSGKARKGHRSVENVASQATKQCEALWGDPNLTKSEFAVLSPASLTHIPPPWLIATVGAIPCHDSPSMMLCGTAISFDNDAAL